MLPDTPVGYGLGVDSNVCTESGRGRDLLDLASEWVFLCLAGAGLGSGMGFGLVVGPVEAAGGPP